MYNNWARIWHGHIGIDYGGMRCKQSQHTFIQQLTETNREKLILIT
jgi:hypothetical protein